MRCFRSCFCLPDGTKKPKSSSISTGNPRRSSYRPLASFLDDNDDPEEVGIPRSIHPLPSIREACVTHKKVRFDLNVQAYEPIPPAESDSPEGDAEEIIGQKSFEETTSIVAFTEGSVYPSNYRYQNCRDNSDEEDDGFLCDDSDLEFEHDIDDYFSDDETCKDSHQLHLRSRKDEIPTRLDSLCSSSEEKELSSLGKLPEEKVNPGLPLGTTANSREPCTAMRSSKNARFRNHYVHSVLNPVENTMQWKTVKARAARHSRKLNKENMESERELEVPSTTIKASEQAAASCKSNSQVQHVSVNASLSSWLVPVEH